MLNTLNRLSAARLGSALLLGTTLLVAGCSTDEFAMLDRPAHDNFYERYPIKVAKAPVKMGVGTRTGSLQPGQINAVAAFGRQAVQNAYSSVQISYPSGAQNGRSMASEVGEVLLQQGVPAGMITAASYPGGTGEPIQLSYTRKVAVTKECGDWSRDLSTTYANTDYPNFGCAVQHNTAAMVANPQDFETMRPMDPALASLRMPGLMLYFGQEDGGKASTKAPAGSGGSDG